MHAWHIPQSLCGSVRRRLVVCAVSRRGQCRHLAVHGCRVHTQPRCGTERGQRFPTGGADDRGGVQSVRSTIWADPLDVLLLGKWKRIPAACSHFHSRHWVGPSSDCRSTGPNTIAGAGIRRVVIEAYDIDAVIRRFDVLTIEFRQNRWEDSSRSLCSLPNSVV